MRSSHVVIAGLVLAACHNGESPLPPVSGQIAFKSNRGRTGQQFDILLMNADGSGLVNLTDSLAYDDWPAWSHDGSKIAFQSDRFVNAAQPLDIFVMNADGTNVVRLTTDTTQEGEPAWSPDGSKIVFVSNRDSVVHIYLVAPDGRGLRQVTSGGAQDFLPRWRP